jgi:putative IMPACT (imprinted ancient) family translation regulator
VRGSRFLALAGLADDEASALACVDAARREHHDATHVAFAFRLRGGRTRAADAGEPAGTAGRPILAAIDAARLVDAVVVVVRWFGGTKLGTAGLARAYGQAARRALCGAGVENRYEYSRLVVESGYEQVAAVKRLVAPPEVVLVAEEFGATARFTLDVRRSRRAPLEARLAGARVRLV